MVDGAEIAASFVNDAELLVPGGAGGGVVRTGCSVVGVGGAGEGLDAHVPLCRGLRQFITGGAAFREQADAARRQKRRAPGEQGRERGERPGGDQRGGWNGQGLDAHGVHVGGCWGGADGFAQEGRLAVIGFDEIEVDVGRDRQHQSGQAGAGAEVDGPGDAARQGGH